MKPLESRHVLLIVVVAIYIALAAFAFPYTVDDAFVTARYAMNLAHGAGYVMNVGGAATDGVTGPLALVPEWLAAVLGFDPVLAMKALGVLCMAGACALAVVRGRTNVARAVTGLACALSSTLVVWGVAGLETGLATLVFTVLALRPNAKGGVWLLFALVPWLRPELVPASAVLVLAVDHGARKWAALSLAAGLIAVVAFRLALFGDLVPLAVHAKPATVDWGSKYALLAVVMTTGLAGAVLAVLGARSSGGTHDARIVACACAAHLVAVACAGGDWMPGFRLVAPVFPAYTWLVGRGASEWLPRRHVLAAALTAFTLAFAALDSFVQLPRAREAGLLAERRSAELRRTLGRIPGPVALVDVGRIVDPTTDVLDLGGITDPVVAHSPGSYLEKHIDVGYLAARNPRTILIHSSTPPRIDDHEVSNLTPFAVEALIIATPWFRTNYTPVRIVPYATDYFYVSYLRDAKRAN